MSEERDLTKEVLKVVDSRCKICRLIKQLMERGNEEKLHWLGLDLGACAAGLSTLEDTAKLIEKIYGVKVSWLSVRRHLIHTGVYDPTARKIYRYEVLKLGHRKPKERIQELERENEKLRKRVQELEMELEKLRKENELLKELIKDIFVNYGIDEEDIEVTILSENLKSLAKKLLEEM